LRSLYEIAMGRGTDGDGIAARFERTMGGFQHSHHPKSVTAIASRWNSRANRMDERFALQVQRFGVRYPGNQNVSVPEPQRFRLTHKFRSGDIEALVVDSYFFRSFHIV